MCRIPWFQTGPWTRVSVVLSYLDVLYQQQSDDKEGGGARRRRNKASEERDRMRATQSVSPCSGTPSSKLARRFARSFRIGKLWSCCCISHFSFLLSSYIASSQLSKPFCPVTTVDSIPGKLHFKLNQNCFPSTAQPLPDIFRTIERVSFRPCMLAF